MWDCNGLECLFDITDVDGDMLMSKLKGETYKVPYNLSMMMMRARANLQRSYEIYSFTTVDMDYDDVKSMFETDPQVMVNAIREQGHMIHSDYNPRQKVIS
jgi:hypothetical protein